MYEKPRLGLRLRILTGLFALASAALCAPPEVFKIEPPNWWTGHSLNPIRILLRGRYFQAARLEPAAAGVRISHTQVNAAGTYLFADLAIDPRTPPGHYPLRLSNADGSTVVPFEVLAPLSRQGRFQGFSSDDVIYLIMPDRFANGDPSNDDPPASRDLFDRALPRSYHGGDFQGILDRLPYLKDLGVTAIWLTPVYDNVNHPTGREANDRQAAADYHGYGAVDFYGVEEHFGGLRKFRDLIDAAHRLGIKVIQDQVANHTSPYHPWVQDPPSPTWFNGTEFGHRANTWQIWTLVDPHATAELRKSTLDGWFANLLPDLDQNDSEVARYLIQNTLWWIGSTGIDGIRQDTLAYVPRRFWRDWRAAIRREYPALRVVGEVWDRDPAVVAFFQGGRDPGDGIDTGIDSLFDFPLYYAIRAAFAQGKSVDELARTLAHDGLYPNPARLVTFLGLHDVRRFMSEPGSSTPGLKLAQTFLAATRGIPLIYYGDEIGMRGGEDPDNRRDFPGGWREDPRDAFQASGRNPEEQSVFEHLQRLMRLRTRLAPLRRGSLVNLAVEEQTYAFARILEGETVIVLFNNSSRAALLQPNVAAAGLREGSRVQDAFGAETAARVEHGRIRLELAPRSARILVAAPGQPH